MSWTASSEGIKNPSNDLGLFDVSAFEQCDALQRFFRSVPTQWQVFDILNVPPDLWQSLYLADVKPTGEIMIRLVGDSIWSWFDRDLRGIDLRGTTHGEHSQQIVRAYESASKTGKRFAIRQRVFLPTPGFVVRLECGVAPMMEDGEVRHLLGFLFLGRFHSQDPGDNEFIIVR